MTRNPVALSVSILLMMATSIVAAEPLVFVSAFAPGEKGAIHAFQFDTKTGGLKPLHRTADIQHPFFLAVAQDKRFLYAIDAEQFGGKENEFVAAYAIKGRTGMLERLNRRSARGSAS